MASPPLLAEICGLIFKEVLTITKNSLQGEGNFIYKKNPGPKAPGFIFTVRLSGYKLLRS